MGVVHRDLARRVGRRLAHAAMDGGRRWPAAIAAMVAGAYAYLRWMQASWRTTCREEDAEEEQWDAPGVPLRALRRAETVLRRRCTRIVAVLERCSESRNHEAVLRTCECLGVQHVWIVEPSEKKKPNGRNPDSKQKEDKKCKREKLTGLAGIGVARQTYRWLTVKSFQTTSDCISALKDGGYDIWATDISSMAECLETAKLEPLPQRIAVVFGREATGVSPEFLKVADRRIYLQLHGFTDSLNLSVAAGMVLYALLCRFPEVRGDIDEDEKRRLRKIWFTKLGRNDAQRQEYAALADALPLQPFADVRPHADHRGAWISPKIRRRLEEKEGPLTEGRTEPCAG